MPPDNDSSSLKFRFGLWLHRVFIRLRLLKHPWRNKHRHNTDSVDVDEWENRWSVFQISLKTMIILLVFDIAVVAAFAYFQLSMTAIIMGTGLLLIANLPVQLWTLGRMRKARRDQWENE